MVWSEQGVMIGFQFAYDKPRAEKAITWLQDVAGLQHTVVDDGEHRPGKPKATPVLVTDAAFDCWHICGLFLRVSRELPLVIRDQVCAALIHNGGNLQGST